MQRISCIINGNLHEGHWDGGRREEEDTEEVGRDSGESKQVAVELLPTPGMGHVQWLKLLAAPAHCPVGYRCGGEQYQAMPSGETHRDVTVPKTWGCISYGGEYPGRVTHGGQAGTG